MIKRAYYEGILPNHIVCCVCVVSQVWYTEYVCQAVVRAAMLTTQSGQRVFCKSRKQAARSGPR